MADQRERFAFRCLDASASPLARRAGRIVVAVFSALLAYASHAELPVDDDDPAALATPTVSLTSPAANAVFAAPATITFSATAKAPAVPIKRVDFYQGTTLLGTGSTAPYTFTWSSVAAGAYSLSAKATSRLGFSALSNPVAVRVCAIPSVALTAPVSGSALAPGSVVTLKATATSPANACAITKVEFYQQTSGTPVLIGTALGLSPYKYNWTAGPVGNSTLTAKAYDERGVTATSAGVSIIVDQPPVVTITSPASGSVFAPAASIAITATATDADGTIAKVEFYNGAALLGTSTTTPYGFTWASVAKGNYSLTAKAYDNLGATTTSAAVPVIVTQKPSVSITSPANNAVLTAPASTTIAATASDPDGTIAKVEFYSGASLLCIVTTSPYQCAWNSVPAGAYSLTAVAYDNQGAATTSAAVAVTVNQPPTVTLTSPANNATFSAPATITLSATAADSDGTISKVEFYNGATLLGTDTTSPYSFSWASVPAGTYTLTAKATDNRGTVTTSSVVTVTVSGANPPPPPMALKRFTPATVSPGATSSLSVTLNPKLLYVANYTSNTVSVIDTAASAVIATIPVGGQAALAAVNSAGTRLYVANGQSNTVSVINTANNTVIGNVTVGETPYGIAVNPKSSFAYVTNVDGNSVSVVNTTTNTLSATVPVGMNPTGIVVNSAGSRVYVINAVSRTVSVIDTASNTVIANVNVGFPAQGIAVHPSGSVVYVANGSGNSISIIDAGTNTITSTVVAAGGPSGITFNPTGTRAYAANYSGNSVSVIDTSTRTVVGTIPTGPAPLRIAINPAGTKLFVAMDGNSLTVIDVATSTVTGTIAVGGTPLLDSNSIVVPFGGATTGVAFTDVYPAGLVNTATASPATTCGGTVTASNGGNSVALSGGTIPANDSCIVTVKVSSATAGNYTNTTSAISSSAGTGAAASATLTVAVANPPPVCSSLTATPSTVAVGAANAVTLTAVGCTNSPTAYDWSLNGTLLTTTASNVFIANAPATPGNFTYSVVARNAAGSSVAVLASVTAVANRLPTASILGPANGASGLAGQGGFPTQISVSAQDPDNNLSSLSLYVNGALQNSWATGPTSTSQTQAFNFSTPGTYVISATATDAAGLTTTTTSVFSSLNAVSSSLTPNLTVVAGTMDGTLAVSPLGASTFNIPIAVPPGVAGLAPSLSLNYSSQGSDGLLGHGWSLSGTSMITRCPRTIAQDGDAGSVTFASGSNGDRFCLDGQRLVLVSGTYGGDQSEYRTEIDGFSRIVAHYPDPAICPQATCWNGISYFQVFTKSGQTLYYGVDFVISWDQAAVLRRLGVYSGDTGMAWALFRVEDRRGNFMSFSYAKESILYDGAYSDTNHRPIAIDYGGNNRVTFTYDSARTDPIRGFQYNVKTDNDKRLTAITAYTNSTTVSRQYVIDYVTAAGSGRSLVNTISECDGSGTCLPATRFGWTARSAVDNKFTSANWPGPVPFLPALPAVTDLTSRVASGDFNGDGRLDLITSDGSAGWTVCPSTGSQFVCSPALGLEGLTGYRSDDVLFGDFNGDGRTDIAIIPSQDAAKNGYWRVCLANNVAPGVSFTCQSIYAPVEYGSQPGDYLVADFLGDGRDGIAARSDILCRLNIPSGIGFTCGAFSNVGDALADLDIEERVGLRKFAPIGNFNGAGRADVATWTRFRDNPVRPQVLTATTSGYAPRAPWGPTLPSSTNLVSPFASGGNAIADFHGSGYADLVMDFYDTGNPNDSSTTYFCRSTGTKFDCANQIAAPVGWGNLLRDVADFDGDGRPDLLVGFNAADFPAYPFKVCQRYGDVSPCANWPIAAFVTGTDIGPLFGDFNGDGATDLATYNKNTHVWTVYLAGTASQDLLQTVTDGYGRSSTLTYKQLNDSSVYTPEYTAVLPQRNVNAGMWVVSQMSTDNGVGGNFDSTYQYTGLRTDVLGRGSLGFRVVDVTDQVSHIRTTTTYRQDFPFTGMASDVASIHLGTQIRYVANTYNLGLSSGGAAQFPFLQRAVETDNEFDGSAVATVTTSYGYTVYGNPSSVTVRTDSGGDTFISATSFTYYAPVITSTKWVVNLVNRVILEKIATNPASDIIRTTLFEYDPTYFDLSKQTVEPSDSTSDHSLKLVTALTRDAYGNVTRRTLQWTDAFGSAQSRNIETLNFAPTGGRYPRTVTNALGQAESRYYDDRTGKLTQVVSVDGVATNWQYDGFGRQTLETRPDGTSTRASYVKCNTSIDTDCSGAASAVISQAYSGSTRIEVPSIRYLDRLGRSILAKTFSFDGTKVLAETVYNAQGRIQSAARPHKSPGEARVDMSYAYDDLGRATAVTYPTDTGFTSTGTSYTANTRTSNLANGGQRIELVNGLGKFKRVTERIDASQATTKVDYQYDAFGNLTRTIDQKGNTVAITYDLLGRKKILIDPDLGTWTYNVDALGQVTSQTDAKGQVSTFVYDALGRKTSQVEAGVTTGTWNFDSCRAGKLCSAATAASGYSRTQGYDGLGRAISVNTAIGAQSFTSATTYDAYGRLQSAVHQHSGHSAVTIGYGFNAQGQLAQLAGSDATYWQANTRNGVGHVTKETLGNAMVTQRSYFANSARLNTIQTGPGGGSTVQSDVYTYDNQGNLATRSNRMGINPVVSETLSYDYLNRLRSASVGAKSYTYDEIGNLITKTGVGSGAYAYGQIGCTATSKPHAVTSIPGVGNLCYDTNGNLTSGNGVTNITWTAFNMPVAITKGTSTDTFTYGPEHQRITQVQTGGTNQTITYAGAVELIGTTARTYLPFSVGVVVETGTGSRTVLYFHKDHLGSTSGISNSDGMLFETFAFDPWGKRRNLDGTDAGSLGAINDRYGYTGQEMLDSVGLVHMNGRVYDPQIGHFLSADPYVTAPYMTQAYSRYSYVNDNPLTLTDPSGYVGEPVACSPPTCIEVRGTPDPSNSGILQFFVRNNLANTATGLRNESMSSSYQNNLQGKWQLKRMAKSLDEIQRLLDQLAGSCSAGVCTNRFTQGLFDWWPGYQIGTCIANGGCSPADWVQATGGTALAVIGGVEIKGGAAAASILEREIAQVTANRLAGNAFRDEIAALLRQAGYEVDVEVYKWTIFGKRFIDIEVSRAGQVLGGIETKYGDAVYSASQRAKDAWLYLSERYRVNVLRGP